MFQSHIPDIGVVVTPSNRAFCRFTTPKEIFDSKGQKVLRGYKYETIQNCAADVSDEDMLLVIQIFRNAAATSVTFIDYDCLEVEIRIPFLWNDLKLWVLQCILVYQKLPVLKWIGPEVKRRSFTIYGDTDEGAGPTIATTGLISRRKFAPEIYYQMAYTLTDQLFAIDPSRPDQVESLTLGFSCVHLSVKDSQSWRNVGNSAVRLLRHQLGWVEQDVEVIRGIGGTYGDFERRHISISEAVAA